MNKNKITSASSKPVGVPKTVQEKYDKLLLRNNSLANLRAVFELDVSL